MSRGPLPNDLKAEALGLVVPNSIQLLAHPRL
jgi:hypothetical protein